MKELTIEEKAKRYDEAIERAKIKRDEYLRLDGPKSHVPQDIEFIFPALKESEDEKIRKWIRKELESKYVVDNIVNNEMADKAFAWLEKQGEQKMKTEPKDVIDVPLIDIPFGAKDSELIGATYFIPKGFHAEIEDDKVIFKKGEQKSVWSEEDEERFVSCLQRLRTSNLEQPETINTIWLKSLKERMQPQPKQKLSDSSAWSEENEYVDLGLPSGTKWKDNNESGYHTYDEAVEKFADKLPTKEQWEELKDKCKWEWLTNGYKVTGPNGNTIYLPADGYFNLIEMENVSTHGHYWSSTSTSEFSAWYMHFQDAQLNGYSTDWRYGLSIRLVKY